MKQIYLASAYSYKSKFKFISWLVRYYRYRFITRIAAKLTEKYRQAFVLPITQSYQMAKFMKNKGTGFKDWADIDFCHIEASEEVWVVLMSGWKESIGVQAEIRYALDHHKRLRYIDAKSLKIVANYTVHCRPHPNIRVLGELEHELKLYLDSEISH